MNNKPIPSSFFVRSNGRYVRINFCDILYVEALRNFCKIYTRQKTYLIIASLKSVEAGLPAGLFCRIHRSFIVAIDKIEAFDVRYADISGCKLPIGDTYQGALTQRVHVIPSEPLKQSKPVLAQPDPKN